MGGKRVKTYRRRLSDAVFETSRILQIWLEYVGADICPIYQCCKDKGEKHCGNCPKLPCEKFMKDPNFSDEENEANLKKMIENLKDAL